MNSILARSARPLTVRPGLHARPCAAPSVRPHCARVVRKLVVSLASSSGETAPKSLTETAALDGVIDRLMEAKNEQEVARVVAENIFQVDTSFWMRMAIRNDSATSDAEKQQLGDVANKVMTLVDAMVKKTEQQLEDSSQVLQHILTAAADEKGDWYLPLSNKQVERVRATMELYSSQLDEALLSNAFAWIDKCQKDHFDSMGQLIQKILQLYAGRTLRGAESSGVEGVLNDVLYAEVEEWDAIIKVKAASGVVNAPDFMDALQKRMEAVVLGQQSGSYAQRVQAEYLKEVEARVKHVFKDIAGV